MLLRLTNNWPVLPRVLPFALYILFLGIAPLVRDLLADPRWIYPLQAGTALAALIVFRRAYVELKTPLPRFIDIVGAVLVGALVFVAWINLDVPYLAFTGGTSFDPRVADGGIDPLWAIVRIAGAALVVPLMEELFWRSFVLRWIVRPDFTSIHPAVAGIRGLALSSLAFGFEHSLWFAGIVAGLAYGGLYMWRNCLWSAVIAHAVTNLVLGLWVLQTGNWQFW